MIRKVGIIGSGKMGTDIFNYLSDFNFKLILHSLFEEEKEKLENSFQKKISRQLKHLLINQEQYNLKSKFLITTDLTDLKDCDLILESITEDQNAKKNLFKDLELIVKKDCILASNSSSNIPSLLSSNTQIVGMHFFYPVAFKNVVELIIQDGLSQEIIELTKSLLSTINKKAFIQNEQNAFLLNRFLLDIQLKAFETVRKYKINYNQFDYAIQSVIPDFGVFEMMDQVGHQTMYNAIWNYAKLDGPENKYSPLLNELQLKIDSKSKFNDNDVKDLPVLLKTEINSEISKYMIELFNRYNSKYKIDSLVFKEYLNDFCGIVL
ncbi:MAG TPA: hypothetical protein DCG75_06940 [Bacteroidales bacterium]|nr:hypothetical protein [Bacteroidales bacterium]